MKVHRRNQATAPIKADQETLCGTELACIEEGVDFFGSDVGYIGDTETSLQCACSCRKKEECKFFTYNAATKLCILKATEGTRRSHSSASSGSEMCCEDDIPTETDQGKLELYLIYRLILYNTVFLQYEVHI